MSTVQTPPVMWLVDASIYIFRAWFTWPDTLVDHAGHPVNAVYGFLEFVYTLLLKEKPELIGFAFDQSLTNSHRKKIYPAYKANREPAPAELKFQFMKCRELISAMGLQNEASYRYEADDIIGTWAARAHRNGHQIHVITGDKDLSQLIGQRDLWWEYGKDIRRTPRDIEKKYGVRPDQMADLLAIAGDKSDNIPGVPGIGSITAAKLLKKFDNIENLLSRTPEIGCSKLRGAKRLQGLIEAHRATILLARQLTAIVCDIAPSEITPNLQRNAADIEMLEDLFEQLGIHPNRRQQWYKLLKN